METLGIFQFGEFQVDPGSRTLKRGEETLALSRRAFDVLVYLVRNPGKVLSKEELLKNVWPDAYVDENSLTQSISVLRKALGEKPGGNSYIVTLPGRGYQFACPVHTSVPPASPAKPEPAALGNGLASGVLYTEQTVRTSVVTKEELVQPKTSKPVLRIALAAVFLAAIGLGGFLVWRHAHRIPPSPVVVIADLENATGEPGLDQVLDSAVTADLKQSPYLNFLSRVHVQETLTQMQQKTDVPLTPALAREICLRNNAQVTLKGVIAKLGRKYLFTLDATDCVSGDSLATSKAEADTADGISHAIDTASADIRKKLGESRASIQRFDTPLVHENTGSLEALRSYSNARVLMFQGKYANAIPLLQRAIELDPKFAVAYVDLAVAYGNSGNHAENVAYLAKAYELRDLADERNRLLIIALYHEHVTGNMDEALRNYRHWTEVYPQNPTPWGNMATIYNDIGQAESAIPLAKRAVAMEPGIAVGYVILARSLLQTGQLDAAKSVCDQAVTRNLDRADLHALLMEVDAARNDAEGVKAQINWGKNHGGAIPVRLNEVRLAFAEGRIRQGQEILAAISSVQRQQGGTGLYVTNLFKSSRTLADIGHLQEARTLLNSQAIPDDPVDPLVTMVETGDANRAEKALNQQLAQHPEDTLWAGLGAPQVRAAVLLARQKPQEAVDALQSALPYELSTVEVPYMRGMAYLEARQSAAAEKEFRKVIDHRGIDPLSHLYPLAHLELARALAQQNKIPESQAVYQQFLALWKDADPDEPLLKQAHAELRKIDQSRG